MQGEMLGLLGLAALLALLLLRVPIGISLISVSFAGMWMLIGPRAAWGLISAVPYEFSAKWTLSSVPMFLLMGYVCYYAGLTKGLFEACRSWLARLPGGLAIASVFGGAGFAAVTGSSIACAAAMGRIAIPEMLARKYDPALATGTLAAAGTLGALIPPSILLILFGVFAEVSISKLFMGGLGMGLLTTALYVATIWVKATLNPGLAPRMAEAPVLAERLEHLRETWPILLLLVVVIGGMFAGLFTATEAGAVGALAAIIIAYVRRALSPRTMWSSLVETLTTTGALFLIAVGANMLSRFLAISGAADLIAGTVVGLQADPLALLVGIAALYLLLGMFLDPLGAMLLTLPILLPVLRESHIDLVWFGVFLAKLLEVGMITPPVGMNVFVIKSVVGQTISLGTIYRGIVAFLIADAVALALVIALPSLVTFLPGLIE
ncbi:TRAP transporter large permease [Rhodoligotrophos defluvii]|uniref:TRAP transporter large permease n=1 Tax=Rhodoligotrophos defluvii TaxID=2561934 RepID=UPI0010C9820C|nr:TRAP transporter large permease subunit [Rhodoligotrophos defluvii]